MTRLMSPTEAVRGRLWACCECAHFWHSLDVPSGKRQRCPFCMGENVYATDVVTTGDDDRDFHAAVLELATAELLSCWQARAAETARADRAERRVRELEAWLAALPALLPPAEPKECAGAWCAGRDVKGTPLPGSGRCLWCSGGVG